jgi:adenosylmethionine-8-amino-7-oxononanoate aminotransferase
LIAFEEGFHGDTFGAMSVSGLSVYNGPFEDFFLKVVRIPTPTSENLDAVLSKLKSCIAAHNCAAFVYEPLVQGAAGMKIHSAEGLEQLLTVCRQHDILCIADEVMTGFGKTGKYFASQYLQTQPDMMCLSKALTAGVAAMSITTCTQKVFDAFLDDEIAKGFFHAHTYSANPLACRAAIAGIELLTSEGIQEDIKRIERQNAQFAERIKQHANVVSVRQIGVILALDLNVEMDRYGNLRNTLFEYYMQHGVFLRPLGNTVYLLPPYVITNKQLSKIYEVIENSLEIV